MTILKLSAATVLLGAFAAAGCASYEVVDPPSDAFGQNDEALAPGVSLAVVVSDADVTYSLSPWLGMMGVHKPMREEYPKFDALSAVVDTLREDFKTVDRVASVNEAKLKGYDLVVAVKVDFLTGAQTNKYEVCTLKMDFTDPNSGPLTSLTSIGKSMVMQDNIGYADLGTFGRARKRALQFMAIAMRQNAPLREFAAKHPGSAPVAAAPAVAAAAAAAPAPPAPAPALAPAAKSYRGDAETPAFNLPEDEHKFALVVGVEKYAELPPAEHAARDAQAVKAHLLALGYPERNIIYLTDNRALKTGLEKYVESWLPRNVDENSTVFFYFSGHGAPDPGTGQAYLVPWDGDPKFLDTTGYPVKRLYQKLNALKAKKLLVAIDSCFSGTGGRSVLAKGARPLVSRIDTGNGVVGRVAALTASASDEMSGIDEASGHGLFTYQLLKAMDAKAGKATMKELFDALSPKVRDAARRDNRDQTPQLIGDGAASL